MTFSDQKKPLQLLTVSKKGSDLKIGDTIEVNYGSKKDTIVGFEPYSGPLNPVMQAKGGGRRMLLHVNRDGIAIFNEEIYKVFREDKFLAIQPVTEIKRQSGCFFTCLGKNLKAGDVVDVGWSNDGDTILSIRPYIGPMLNQLEKGASEAFFAKFAQPVLIDCGRMYNVFSRRENPSFTEEELEKADAYYTPQLPVKAVEKKIQYFSYAA